MMGCIPVGSNPGRDCASSLRQCDQRGNDSHSKHDRPHDLPFNHREFAGREDNTRPVTRRRRQYLIRLVSGAVSDSCCLLRQQNDVPAGYALTSSMPAGTPSFLSVFGGRVCGEELRCGVSEWAGAFACESMYRSESRARLKSPDRNVSVPTELSDAESSATSPGSCGPHRIRPRNSPALPMQACALPRDGYQARSSRPTSLWKPQCTRRSSETEFCRVAFASHARGHSGPLNRGK